MSTLVETTALALPEVKTGLVEWNWQKKYCDSGARYATETDTRSTVAL